MVQYTQSDYLNELSRILRGAYSADRVSGVVDAESQHAQVMELARTVFMLRPQSFFYLAKLVKNTLRAVAVREVAYVEDMLAALLFLERSATASPIGNQGPSQLRDASAALLRLDGASGSLRDRRELVRFSRIIDDFAGDLRPSVASEGQLRLTMTEARSVLRDNVSSLVSIHSALLSVLSNLRLLLASYDALDLPTQFSATALVRIRQDLQALALVIESSSVGQNDQSSRAYLLRVLAGRVIAALVSSFERPDPSAPVLTSGNEGLVANGSVGVPGGSGTYLAQAAGEGTAAEALSGPGPWLLDSLLSTVFSFRVDGGPVQVFDLSVVQGPGLHGDHSAPFSDEQLSPVWPGPQGPDSPPPPPPEEYLAKNRVHVVVDSSTYSLTSQEWGWLGTDNVWRDGFQEDQPPSPLFMTDPRTEVRTRLDISISLTVDRINRVEELYNEYWDSVRCQPPRKLGFKHLGTPVYFALGQPAGSSSSEFVPGSGFGGWEIQSDTTLTNPGEWEPVRDRRWPYIFIPRTIVELAPLANFTMSLVPGASDTYRASNGTDPQTGDALLAVFTSAAVGYYIRVGTSRSFWERYEIVEVIDEVTVRIDPRGDTISPAAQPVTLFGQRGDYTQFTFSPDLLADTDDVANRNNNDRGPWNIPDTCEITVGSSVKTALIPLGQGGSIQQVVAALSDPSNGDAATNKYAHASYHCIFREQPGFTGRLTIQGRSRFLSDQLAISPTAILTRPDLQQPNLGAVLVAQTVGDIPAGSPLNVLTAPSGTFDAVSLGDRLEVLGGYNEGGYRITAVQTDQVTVDGEFNFEEASIQFQVRASGGLGEHPGPFQARNLKFSAHEVLGFESNEAVDPANDPYLSVEELEAVLREGIDTATTELEVLEEDVFGGLADLVANSSLLVDASAGFLSLGIGAQYLVELQEGPSAGEYIVIGALQSSLTLQMPPGMARGFTASEASVPYRVFRRRLRIASTNAGPGSSVEVVAAPSVLGFAAGVQVGTTPSIEAVNEAGESMDLSGLQPGDHDADLVVESVSDDGSTAVISGGVSSTLSGRYFSFTGVVQESFSDMLAELETVATSRNRLAKNGLTTDLEKLDAAISPLLTPGAAFASNVNRARLVLQDLLQSLTSEVVRFGEHGVQPDGGPNVLDATSRYSPAKDDALDVLLNTLDEFGFDRALRLLVTGDLVNFFSTTYETASYAGAVMAAARTVRNDLPSQSQTLGAVRGEESNLVAVEYTADSDSTYETVEDEGSPLV